MDRVLHCKNDNERDRRFASHTLLLEEESGKRYFLKVPDTPEAEEHVQNLVRCEQELREFYDPDQIHINSCRIQDTGVKSEYIEGTTLAEEIDRKASGKKFEEALSLIDQFFARTQPQDKLQPFRQTEAFCAVFGTHGELQGVSAVSTACMNMDFSHVLRNADGWHLTDCEWTFCFPVPAEFLRFRAIQNYLKADSGRAWLSEAGWERWKIGPERLPHLEAMERCFQKYVLGDHIPMRTLYTMMSPGAWDLHDACETERRFQKDTLRIYWSQDGTLSEEQTLRFTLEEGWNTITAELPEGTRMIRLDPGERSAICSMKNWTIDGRPVQIADHNGIRLSEQVWVFPQPDPQWLAAPSHDPMREMRVEIKVQPADAELLAAYGTGSGEKKRKRLFEKKNR